MSGLTTHYDRAFYEANVEGSLRSARSVVPVILDLLPVRSVVDFGCGRGTWLRAFAENGVETVLGIDGDYVEKEQLLIDRTAFRPADLRKPVRLDRTYDLALSLEVAEHLPTRASRVFVESLVRAAPVVIFSAAIPGQGGTHHINEQWPDFWQRLFRSFDYHRLDLIRPRIGLEPGVEWWYRQNIVMFAQAQSRVSLGYTAEAADPCLEPICRQVLNRYKTISGLSSELVRAVCRSMKNRLARVSERV